MPTLILKGDKKLMRNLKKLQRQTSNLRPMFKKIGIYMMGSINRVFQAEGKPKWIDIVESTKKARTRKGKYPGKILQVSGRLKGSIVYKAGNRDVAIGTSVPYASFLQSVKGEKMATRHIPSRPFLQWLDEDIQVVHRIFEDYLKRTVFAR